VDGKPLINRLLSGIVIFKLKGEYVYVRPARAEDKAFADVYAQEVYEDALLDGILRNKDLEELLIDEGWWSKEQEEEIETLSKNLEQMKLDYCNHFSKQDTKDYIKKSIDRLREKISKLYDEKHTFFGMSCEYLRDFAKSTMLLEKCAFLVDGSLAIEKIGIMRIIGSFMANNLNEEQLRGVAKSYDWRNLWASKELGLFDCKTSELTQEQASLISWSRFYDGVYESMDRPNEKIIEDDLALDGWAISESRKRDEEEKKRSGEKLAGGAQDAGEIFIPVGNQKEQDDVLALNDTYGKSVLKSKAKQFEEGGVFNENELKHVKKDIQMESLRQVKESRRR